MNFDEFNTYTKEKKLKKLDEVAETVKSGEMPLSSYTIIHHDAKLSSRDKSEIEKWVVQVKKKIN